MCILHELIAIPSEIVYFWAIKIRYNFGFVSKLKISNSKKFQQDGRPATTGIFSTL